MIALPISEMYFIESGRSTVQKVVDGVCHTINGVSLASPIAVKLGLITISPVAAGIIALANLGCVGWYLFS